MTVPLSNGHQCIQQITVTIILLTLYSQTCEHNTMCSWLRKYVENLCVQQCLTVS